MKNAIYMLCGGEEQNRREDLLNSFILTSEQGTVVVVDGGHRFNAQHLLKRLKEITGQYIPHIDAWILSHAHEDHVEAFIEILEKYPESVLIDKVIYDFYNIDYLAECEKLQRIEYLKAFEELKPMFAQKEYIPRIGDSLDIGDMHFEILFDARAEMNAKDINNRSIVFTVSYGGKKAIFLGDLGVEGGEKLLDMWQDTDMLQSDICQMAHHGNWCCKEPVYQAIRPSVCLWPTPNYVWNNDVGGGYNTFIFNVMEVRSWIEKLNVKENLIMKDGDQEYSW